MNATAAARPARGKPAATPPFAASSRVAHTESRRIRKTRVRQRQRLARQSPAHAARSVATILLVKPPWAQTMTVWRLLAMIPGWGPDRAQTRAGALAHEPLADVDAVARARLASSTARACAHRNTPHIPQQRSASIESIQGSLRAANRVRLARAAVLADITTADSPVNAAVGLLVERDRDSELDGLAASKVIKAVPRFGPTAARKLVTAITGRSTSKLSELTPEAARQIAQALTAPAPRSRTIPA